METIKFYELVNLIDEVTNDDKTDLRIFNDDYYRWTCLNEEGYKEITNQLDTYSIKGNGWKIYLGYDVSGFGYWVEQMEESNYVMIVIAFENEDIDKSEINNIIKALESTQDYCQDLEDNTITEVNKLENR